MPMFDKPFLLFPIHQPMFRHLFELRSRTTVIGIRIDRDASTRSKDSRDFDIFGVHQFNKVFHDDIYTIFMKSSMIAEAEKVEFQTFALRISAKSGCPVMGHRLVNSGQLKRTQ